MNSYRKIQSMFVVLLMLGTAFVGVNIVIPSYSQATSDEDMAGTVVLYAEGSADMNRAALEILGQKDIDNAWVYENNHYVYHMSGINFTTNAPTALIIKGKLTIDVVGVNTITTMCPDSNGGLGVIYSDSTLYIQSDDPSDSVLNINNLNKYPRAGIYCEEDMFISSTTVNVDTADAELSEGNCYGLFGRMVELGGDEYNTHISITMGDLSVDAGTSCEVSSYGIYSTSYMAIGAGIVNSKAGNISVNITKADTVVDAISCGCFNAYQFYFSGDAESNAIFKGGDVDYQCTLAITQFTMSSVSMGLHCDYIYDLDLEDNRNVNVNMVAQAGSVHGNNGDTGRNNCVSSIALETYDYSNVAFAYSTITLRSSFANNESAVVDQYNTEISSGIRFLSDGNIIRLLSSSLFVVSEGCKHCESFGLNAKEIHFENQTGDEISDVLSIIAKSCETSKGSIGYKKTGNYNYFVDEKITKKPTINIVAKSVAVSLDGDSASALKDAYDEYDKEGGTILYRLPSGKYTKSSSDFGGGANVVKTLCFSYLPSFVSKITEENIYYYIVTDAYGRTSIRTDTYNTPMANVVTPTIPTDIPAGMEFSHWKVTDAYGTTANIEGSGTPVPLSKGPCDPMYTPTEGDMWAGGPIYFTAVLKKASTEEVPAPQTSHVSNTTAGTTVVLYANSGEEVNRTALKTLGQKDTGAAWEWVDDHYVYHMSGIDYSSVTPCAVMIIGNLVIDVVGKNTITSTCKEFICDSVIKSDNLTLKGDSSKSALNVKVDTDYPDSGIRSNEMTIVGLTLNVITADMDFNPKDKEFDYCGISASKMNVGDDTSTTKVNVKMGKMEITREAEKGYSAKGINSNISIIGDSTIISKSSDITVDMKASGDAYVYSEALHTDLFKSQASTSGDKPQLVLVGGDIDYVDHTVDDFAFISRSKGLYLGDTSMESSFNDCRISASGGNVLGHVSQARFDQSRSAGDPFYVVSIGLDLKGVSGNLEFKNSSIYLKSSLVNNDIGVSDPEISSGIGCFTENTHDLELVLTSTTFVVESSGCVNNDSFGVAARTITLKDDGVTPSLLLIDADNGSTHSKSFGIMVHYSTDPTSSPLSIVGSKSFVVSQGSYQAVNLGGSSTGVKDLFQAVLLTWAKEGKLICVDDSGTPKRQPTFITESDILKTPYISYVGALDDQHVAYVAVCDGFGFTQILDGSIGTTTDKCLTPAIPQQSELPQGKVFSNWVVVDGYGHSATFKEGGKAVFDGTELQAGGPVIIKTVLEDGCIVTISGEGITVKNADVTLESGDTVAKQTSLTVTIAAVEGKAGHITANGVEIEAGAYIINTDVEFNGSYTDAGFAVTFKSDTGTVLLTTHVAKDKTIDRALVQDFETKEGHIFAGWYSNGNLWDFANNKVTADTTLVQKWSKDIGGQKVQFILTDNGGKAEVNMPSISNIEKLVVTNNSGHKASSLSFEDSSSIASMKGKRVFVSIKETSTDNYAISVLKEDGQALNVKMTVALHYDVNVGTPTVYSVHDGVEEKVNADFDPDNGIASFVTDHNADYVVKYDKSSSNDNNGLILGVLIVVLIAILIAIWYVAAKRS